MVFAFGKIFHGETKTKPIPHEGRHWSFQRVIYAGVENLFDTASQPDYVEVD